MKTMLVAMMATLVIGCGGRALDIPGDGEQHSAFSSVEASITTKCMLCHSVSNAPIGVFVFSGTESSDYATVKSFMTDGGKELLDRLEHHGALSMDQLADWQQWVDEGAAF